MRFFGLLFFVLTMAFCVKKPSSSPIPEISYKEALNMKQTPQGVDTVLIKIGYEDGDGNLFVDEFSQKSNIFIFTNYYDADSGKFVPDRPTPNSYRIKQPANGYYKGKSIRGYIYVPMSEFRSGPNRKVIQFVVFMEDVSGNKSNTVTSPTYSLDF